MAIELSGLSTAPILSVWRAWFASDLVGIIMVSPLLIELAPTLRERLPHREFVEGVVALVILAVTSGFVMMLPSGPWATAVPAAVLFPLVLWLAARCRPVFAAGATFIIAVSIVWSATYGVGRFGDPSIPLAERVLAGQVGMVAAALCSLVLAALFAERRQNNSALAASGRKLRSILDAANVVAWEADLDRRTANNVGPVARFFGKSEAAKTGEDAIFADSIHPADRSRVVAEFEAAVRDDTPFRTEFKIPLSDGYTRWAAANGAIVHDDSGRPVGMLGVTYDITERKRAQAQQDLLVAELDHRVKNALASVAAVTLRTRDRSGSIEEFSDALEGRIQSMADAHALLSRSRWQGVSLADLVHQELAPYAGADNTEVEGENVVLTATATQAVAMLLHELVTNAAKYGALSTPLGRVCVRWSRRGGEPSPAWLKIEWQETGGPPVVPPAHDGYGTSVIRDLIPYELGGTVELDFAPEGVRCQIAFPLV